MARALKKIDPDVHFRVLHFLEEEPKLTQRELAQKLGISLGGVNYCLKALIDAGDVEIITVSNQMRSEHVIPKQVKEVLRIDKAMSANKIVSN